MSAGTSYNASRFPFAAIFERLTDQMQRRSLSPIDAYLLYQNERRHARLTPCPDYASTSITSGGHARRAGLKMEQIIAANTRTARDLVVLMDQQGTLDHQSVILPVDLGHIPGWRQSDYILFWLLIIGGFDLWIRPGNSQVALYERNLQAALEQFQVDLRLMNSFELSAAARAPQYFRFADACIWAAHQSKTDRRAAAVRKIVSLVDPHTSLGGQTERYFARMLDIPVYLPRAVKPADKLGQAISTPRLARDVETIISYGGTVCEVADHAALVCLRDDEQQSVDASQLSGGLHRVNG